MEPKQEISNIELSLENYEVIENAYVQEESIMMAIQNGDPDEVVSIYENSRFHKGNRNDYPHMAHRLPNDRLRYQRNICIITNTLSRTAARKGGLPNVHLHNISEKFAAMIESASSIEYVSYSLPVNMCKEYAEAVKMFSTKGYSSLIKEVIDYMTSNLTVNITISELAEKFNISSNTLSRRFKEDTGMSITDYINHQRVELAKYYFEKGLESVTEASYNTGYNDSSYFTKVFKKTTGILPTEYIKNVKDK